MRSTLATRTDNLDHAAYGCGGRRLAGLLWTADGPEHASLWVLRARSGATGQAGRVSPSENAPADAPPRPDQAHHDQPPTTSPRRPAGPRGRPPTPPASRSSPPPPQAYVALIQVLLDDAGIDYLSVTGRTKSVASFAAKANRTDGGGPALPRPAAADHRPDRRPRHHLRPQRRRGGRRAARRRARRCSTTATSARRPRARAASATPAATCWSQTRPGAELPVLEGHRASVQVRTVLQHAWAEFEHDIRYKGNVPEDAAADLDRRFTLAAGLIELADREFATIRERIQAAAPGSTHRGRRPTTSSARTSPPSSPATTATPAGRTPTTTTGSPTCSPSSASTRIDDLADLLTSVDADAVIRRMGYRYPAGRRTPPRRRAARDLRRAVRHPRRQQPPGPAAARAAGEADHAREAEGAQARPLGLGHEPPVLDDRHSPPRRRRAGACVVRAPRGDRAGRPGRAARRRGARGGAPRRGRRAPRRRALRVARARGGGHDHRGRADRHPDGHHRQGHLRAGARHRLRGGDDHRQRHRRALAARRRAQAPPRGLQPRGHRRGARDRHHAGRAVPGRPPRSPRPSPARSSPAPS